MKINYYRAELVERIDITAELAIFKFAPEKQNSFIPGQFVSIALPEEDKMVKRPYSICSTPDEPLMEFLIELVPGGKLTPRLFELKVGDFVSMREPLAGKFILDTESGINKHLMVATVAGIAPYISMIRTAKNKIFRNEPMVDRFLIIHSASHPAELAIYQEELTDIAQDGWLIYVPTISRPWDSPDWQGETGRVEDIVRKYADTHDFNHENAIAYACGNPQMIDNVKAVLMRARFNKAHLREEKYFIAR